ncbi:alpha/beta fold hydrolase [Senegalia massiliensis]|uniref:alpha/beta fold hydrolase n=1 Tax=Senegalia massiliensis TaxID=1720316 RepID=UPI001030900D|nr:alpha/beta hydrolase [Senegalia massiliensis]
MSKFKTSDNVEIFYDVQGEGQPIVLIHGWSQNNLAYMQQVEELKKNYKVISYDLRGHGRSVRTEKGLTLDRFACDLRELIDHLELKEVLLIGWSMGASTTFNYVKNYGVEKVSGIVLFDMTPKLLNDDEWNLGLWHGKYNIQNALDDMTIMCNDFSNFAESFFKRAAPYMNDDMLTEAMKETTKNTPHVMYAMWLAMAYNDYRDILSKMTVPTVIAYGENSTLYSKETAAYLNKQIPNSKVVSFENCTHLLVMENPGRATKVIEELANEIFK